MILLSGWRSNAQKKPAVDLTGYQVYLLKPALFRAQQINVHHP